MTPLGERDAPVCPHSLAAASFAKSEVAAGLQKELNAWNATLVEPKWEPLNAPPKK